MKKDTTNKAIKFILGFVLTSAGFMFSGLGFSDEAEAESMAQCTGNGGPDQFWGFRCNNGDCAIACSGAAYTTCADFGATCLMGYPCTPLCPQ